MTISVYVFLNEGAGSIEHVVAVNTGHASKLDHTNASFLDSVSGQVIAVLAGEDVSTWAVQLPDLPDGKLLQILPAQLEDNKAIAFANDHCALLMKMNEDGRLVACVAADVMDQAQRTLAAAGINADYLLPDYLLLPFNAQSFVAASPFDGDRFMARLEDGTGFAGDKLLAAQIAGDVEAVTFDFAQVDTDKLIECNLLQGRYRPKLAVAAYIPLLRRSGALVASILVLLAGSFLLETSQNNAEAEKLQQQSRRLFGETFPEITRVVDMQVQARRAVSSVRAAEGGAFLRISEIVFTHTEAAEGTVIEGVRFNEQQNAFFLTVSFASFTESDQFLRQLRGSGLSVSEGGSRQDNGRVVTDVAIEVLS